MKFNGTHFGINGYTLVANIGVSSVPYRKSREGLQQSPFGGRVTKHASGRRVLKYPPSEGVLQKMPQEDEG